MFSQALSPNKNAHAFPLFTLIGLLLHYLASQPWPLTLVAPDVSPRKYWWPLLQCQATATFKLSLRAGPHFHCCNRCGTSSKAASYESARGLAREMRACKDAIVFPFWPLERSQDFDNLLFECVKLLANRMRKMSTNMTENCTWKFHAHGSLWIVRLRRKKSQTKLVFAVFANLPSIEKRIISFDVFQEMLIVVYA